MLCSCGFGIVPPCKRLNTFPKPFLAAAVNHFRAKGNHVGFDWRDTQAAEHLRSFTVAKAMQIDILEDMRNAIDEALAQGKTFEWFKDELEPMLARKGWWGSKTMAHRSNRQRARRHRPGLPAQCRAVKSCRPGAGGPEGQDRRCGPVRRQCRQ